MAERRSLRPLLVVAAVLAVGGLGASVWYDAHAHLRDGREQSTLTAARHHLAVLRHGVAVTSYANAVTTSRRNGLEASIGATLGQLAGVDASLNSANAGASLEGLGINTLHTCLGGVQAALNQVSANNNAAAAQDISAVSGPCAELDGGARDGLVYPFDFPDPDVITVGSTFYAYATNSVAGNIQIIASSDLTHWSAVGNALPSLPGWATPNNTWAPSVARVNGSYLMYYAVDVAATGTQCISVATAGGPQGPFVDTSAGPLECQQSLGGSIDPSTFIDANGNSYLVWKSGGPGTSRIWSEQLNTAGTGFAAGATPTQLLVPDQAWEAGTVEAPDLVLANGRYFLFFSGNDWNGANYAVGVATCTGPLGPCADAAPGPILSSGSGIAGPGGASVFTDTSGASWIAFHSWIPGAVGFPNSRDLYVRALNLSGAVPSVAASAPG
ncbi:MAG TPA: glycoside hydrolase family 43 protein [Acidimicrobiales bacterium]|nr:glycoside hydrolase family 43 protein [Acidimicrobiales bacterium]